MAAQNLSCVSCGAANEAGRARCNDCGATLDKMEPITSHRPGVGADAPAFAVGWFLAALAIDLVLLAGLIIGLPFAISSYDPQGFPGIAIGFAVWFVSGLVLGRISPYRLYFEIFAAGAISATFIIAYIALNSDVRAMDTGSYVTAGIIGALIAGLGAFFGERKAEPTRVSAVPR
jgi:hypothetical protein